MGVHVKKDRITSSSGERLSLIDRLASSITWPRFIFASGQVARIPRNDSQ